MPLYEYECEQCAARFEVIQRFSDPSIESCQKCGGPVHKLISPPAIQFKGTGWYITDYAKKNGSSPPPTPSSADGDKKSETSSATSASSTPTASGAAETKKA